VRGHRILIRVDGSKEIGLGHIYRMRALAHALTEKDNQVFFLSQADEIANRLLKETNLNCYTFSPSLFNSILRRVLEDVKPDLILQDILETSTSLMQNLRESVKAKIINFDDVGAGLVMSEGVINGLAFQWKPYKVKPAPIPLYEGPQYMILQPEIDRFIGRKNGVKGVPDQASRLLLSFGGTDALQLTEPVLEAINQIQQKLFVTVHLGPGKKSTDRLKTALDNSPHKIQIAQSVRDIFKYFSESDLVVCAGGITLYELAAMGIPSISIAAEVHEISNTTYWSQVGTTISLGWEKTLDFSKVPEVVRLLLNDKRKRGQMSEVGKQKMDCLGLVRVMNAIKGLFQPPSRRQVYSEPN